MNEQSLSDEIRRLIGQNETDDALDLLIQMLRGDEMEKEGIVLKGEFEDYKKEKQIGINEDSSRNVKVNYGILSVLEAYEKKKISKETPFTRDFFRLTEQESSDFERIQKEEIVSDFGNIKIIKSKFDEYPKAARHNSSLFPNNYLDPIDLKLNKKAFFVLATMFKKIIEQKESTERNVLNFINQESAYFIVGSILKDNYTFGHHSLYVFPEFELPPNYKVDYLLVGKSSGGYEFIFVEFENPYNNITLKDGSFGETIRKGLRQIEDWDNWIESNFSHLKLMFEKFKNDSEVLSKEFLDLDKSRIHYALVAGKRSDYNEKTYRLRRKYQKENEILILHYDNLFDFSIKIIGDTTY